MPGTLHYRFHQTVWNSHIYVNINIKLNINTKIKPSLFIVHPTKHVKVSNNNHANSWE